MAYISLSRRLRKPQDPEATCFLPLEIRKGLHAEGWTKIHQHQLGLFAECPAKLALDLRVKSGKADAFYEGGWALLGSVAHLAVADPLPDWSNPGWWRSLFYRVREHHPNQHYLYNGQLVTSALIDKWAVRCTKKLDGWGDRSLGDLLQLIGSYVQGEYEVLMVEAPVNWVDGAHAYPIEFTGTLDMLCATRKGKRRLVLWDLKNFGVFDAFFHEEGVGTPARQSFEPDALRRNRQLLHYAWLCKRQYDMEPKFVGYLLPAHAVPYVEKKRAGEARGQLGVMEDLKEDSLAEYEAATRSLLRMASFGQWPKTYPGNWGKPACPKCSFRAECYQRDPGAEVGDLTKYMEDFYGK